MSSQMEKRTGWCHSLCRISSKAQTLRASHIIKRPHQKLLPWRQWRPQTKLETWVRVPFPTYTTVICSLWMHITTRWRKYCTPFCFTKTFRIGWFTLDSRACNSHNQHGLHPHSVLQSLVSEGTFTPFSSLKEGCRIKVNNCCGFGGSLFEVQTFFTLKKKKVHSAKFRSIFTTNSAPWWWAF